ncbi:MAG: multicopper oxidase domain-containing protein [Chloroflexi bacterium]|nr:multicopper oxidase domain-containing protein [Chloroflexota bacterium]MBU1750556.1 multicopper oxidase domain-containing protein [Chloroflexota bacterium]
MNTMRNLVPFLRRTGSLLLVVGLLLGSWGVGAVAQAAPAAQAVALDLWARTGTLALPDGATVPIWGYTLGAADPVTIPGPTIVANQGDAVQITLHNSLATTTSLYFRGQSLMPDIVGVASGGTKVYSFTAANPGTFLYEAGLTPDGARQVAMGLFGMLIVRPTGQPGWAYGDPATAFDEESTLIFSEIDPAFNLDPMGFSMQYFAPRYWLINGQAYPDADAIPVAATDRVLLRLINAGLQHRSIGLLGLYQGIIAQDGQLMDHPYYLVAESLAAGQTMDSLVSVPGTAVSGAQYALYEGGFYQHNANQRLAPGGPAAFGGILTFLTVGGILPPGDGPLTYDCQITPSLIVGSVNAVLSAMVSDATRGNQNITAAEYFIDNLGAAGTGTPMAGPFGSSPTVAVNATLSVATLNALADGAHSLYIRGKDAGNNWGPVNMTMIVVDRTGPATTGLVLTPDLTNGSSGVTLRGTADDSLTGNAIVTVARYKLDDRAAQLMTLSPTGVPVAGLVATIPVTTVAGLTEGIHTFAVRSQDSLANWGAWATIDLKVDKTGPTTANVIAVPSYLDLTGAPPVTAVRVDAAITDTLVAAVQSPIKKAEGFIDTVGATGSGFALIPLDGMFDEPTEGAYIHLPMAHFAQLTQGDHTIYVRGQDKTGNWGPTGSTIVTVWKGLVGTVGPAITEGPSLSPSSTGGANVVALTAAATDPQALAIILRGEWFQGADPGVGNGNPLQVKVEIDDNGVNAPAILTGQIDTGGWAMGTYTISVRAMNELGNWGPVSTTTLTVDQTQVHIYLPLITHE